MPAHGFIFPLSSFQHHKIKHWDFLKVICSVELSLCFRHGHLFHGGRFRFSHELGKANGAAGSPDLPGSLILQLVRDLKAWRL